MRLSDHERRLVEQARPTVERLARQAKRRFPEIPFDDFVSTGNEAAIASLPQFDPDRGVPFPVFAFQRIRGAMLRQTPRETFGSLHIMIRSALATEVEPPPSDLSIDEALEDTPEKAKERAVAWARRQAAGMLVAALHAASRSTDAAEELALRAERERSARVLASARAALSDDERYFLDRHYGEAAKLDEIAKELGVVTRTVVRMHDRIKTKLGGALRAEGIERAPAVD